MIKVMMVQLDHDKGADGPIGPQYVVSCSIRTISTFVMVQFGTHWYYGPLSGTHVQSLPALEHNGTMFRPCWDICGTCFMNTTGHRGLTRDYDGVFVEYREEHVWAIMFQGQNTS
jgi:hypothetical protein